VQFDRRSPDNSVHSPRVVGAMLNTIANFFYDVLRAFPFWDWKTCDVVGIPSLRIPDS
jgi:hypothetical protein